MKLLTLLILLGFFAYSKFYYFDPEYGCSITIIPTFLPSNYDTKEILRMIKKGSPDDYLRICKYIKFINKNPSCGGFDGGCFQTSKPGMIYIGNDQGNIAYAAAIVVHETCHAIQGAEHKRLGERECYTQGYEYLQTVTQFEEEHKPDIKIDVPEEVEENDTNQDSDANNQ